MEKDPTFQKRELIHEDKQFLRLLLNFVGGQSRIKRWREPGEEPFINSEELYSKRETVMEHVGGMSLVASMIFDKAESEEDRSITDLDFRKIIRNIVVHDSEEILTGDIQGKTAVDRANEEKARDIVLGEAMKVSVGDHIRETLTSYQSKDRPEDRFTKAIDELQGILYIIYTRTFDKQRPNFRETKAYEYSGEFKTLRRIIDLAINLCERSNLVDLQAPEMRVEGFE